MKSFIKNSAFELSSIAAIMIVCGICLWFGGYKRKYELEHYKFEQAQKANDSLQVEKTIILKRAALHANSADSAMALMGAKGKEKLKLIKQYEKINNTIDGWDADQLDSFFSVN